MNNDESARSRQARRGKDSGGTHTVFVTGAAGYIGGSVATALHARGHRVRGLVRSEHQAEQLRDFGMQAVVGSLEDSTLLATEATTATAVVNAADSDHAGAVAALLEGLDGTGKLLVHTSGSSIVGTAAEGELDPQRWDDSIFGPDSSWQPEDYKAPRVAIDCSVVEAGRRGIRGVVLCNTMIYGVGRGLRRDSVQLPPLTSLALRRRVGVHIGAGRNVWSNVHIGDVCDLYVRAVEDPSANGFYFVENGEAAFADIARAIADRYGLSGVEEMPVQLAAEELGYELAVFALSSNSRVRGLRARAELGWRPRESDMLEWIRRA